jgi:ribosomal protein L37AE/L43A
MLSCPQCSSVRVALHGVLDNVYWVRCQGCGYGWESGRWKPHYAEEDEERRTGPRGDRAVATSPLSQMDERWDW